MPVRLNPLLDAIRLQLHTSHHYPMVCANKKECCFHCLRQFYMSPTQIDEWIHLHAQCPVVYAMFTYFLMSTESCQLHLSSPWCMPSRMLVNIRRGIRCVSRTCRRIPSFYYRLMIKGTNALWLSILLGSLAAMLRALLPPHQFLIIDEGGTWHPLRNSVPLQSSPPW